MQLAGVAPGAGDGAAAGADRRERILLLRPRRAHPVARLAQPSRLRRLPYPGVERVCGLEPHRLPAARLAGDGGDDLVQLWLDEDVPIIVDLSDSQAIQTELGASQLHEQLAAALQRYADGRLRSDQPVLDRVLTGTARSS